MIPRIDDMLTSVVDSLTGKSPAPDPFTFTPTLRMDWGQETPRQAQDQKRPEPTEGPLAVLDIARQQIGADYTWASENPVGPEGGPGAEFDCSGLTQYVLAQAGITTPHLASSQQQQFPSVDRAHLQPGDLVFFNYGRKAAGVADHVGVYVGDGMMIAASSSADRVQEQPVDWAHFIGGGSTGLGGVTVRGQTQAGEKRGRGRGVRAVTSAQALERGLMVPLALADTGVGSLPIVVGSLLAPAAHKRQKISGRAPDFTGEHAAIKQQLYLGFMAAGRPDLARAVGTRDFDVWIDAESGWTPYSVSQYFPGHGRNYGLFQFWQGHPWTQEYLSGGTWTADPFTQAKLVARWFDLTVRDIHDYATQIRNGTYHGW